MTLSMRDTPSVLLILCLATVPSIPSRQHPTAVLQEQSVGRVQAPCLVLLTLRGGHASDAAPGDVVDGEDVQTSTGMEISRADADSGIVDSQEERDSAESQDGSEEGEAPIYTNAEEQRRLEEMNAAKPRGPAPPNWPGPYTMHWGRSEPGEPNRYGGEPEVLGRELSDAAQVD